MRIVFATHAYAPAVGGAERYAQGLAVALAGLGHEVHVACTESCLGRSVLHNGILPGRGAFGDRGRCCRTSDQARPPIAFIIVALIVWTCWPLADLRQP